MTEISRAWQGDSGAGALGDAGPYSNVNWREAWQYSMGLYDADGGILANSGTPPLDGMNVVETSPRTKAVILKPGRALVQGTFYENTGDITHSLAANSSGNPRIDSVILRRDDTAQTVRSAVLQGTPAASPVPPALTRAGGIYEISIADITLANGYSVVFQSTDIVQRRLFSNMSNGVYHTNVQNRSGAPLKTGDIVSWSSSFDRAVTTISSPSGIPAGVWVGYTDNLGYGTVLSRGIGLVRVTGTLSRGVPLMQSTSAKIAQRAQAAGSTGYSYGPTVLGFLMEATSFGAGNGLALAFIDCHQFGISGASYPASLGGGSANVTTTSTSFTDVLVGGVAHSTNFWFNGGILYVSFSCVVASSVPDRIDFDISINGVAYGVTDLVAADGVIGGRPAAANVGMPVHWSAPLAGVVPSSLNVGNNNTITLRWKTASGTASIYNSGTAGQRYPIMLNAFGLA